MRKSNNNPDIIIDTQLDKSNSVYYEIITLIFILSFLIIDFLPQFNSVEIIAPQYLFLALLNLFTGFFLYYNPNLISNNFVSIFKNSNAVKAYISFLILCVISIFTARNLSVSIINFMQLVTVFCLFINLAILLNNRLKIVYQIAFLIGISVFIQSFIAFNDFIVFLKSKTFLEGLAQLKGNTGNINIFAASLTGKIPFLILGITYFKKWKKWFLCFVLFLASLLILLTASRASFIALSAEVLIFILLYLKINSEKKATLITLSYIIIPLIISFFTANLILGQEKDNYRYKSVNDRVSQIVASPESDASINARLMYWDNALQIIQKKPLLGIGLGNWKIESLSLEKNLSNNLLISGHPHNDFLEITAETGILNGIIYLILFVFCFTINLKRVFKNQDHKSKIIALIALLLLISYGIDAFFNFPLYRPTMQINFCLFLVLTLINVSQSYTIEDFNFSKTAALSIIFISVITVYFSFSTLKAYQLENDTRVDLLKNEGEQILTSKEILNRIPKFPNVATNSEPFIELAAIYSLREKKYQEASKYLDLSKKINPYTGRSEWFKYRIAKEKGNIDSAYVYANEAFKIRPRNEDYYLSALVASNMKKDTTAILNIHNQYTKYVKTPSNWINSSSALANSNYSNDKIIRFINEGLAQFPNDNSLLERKKSFENALNIKNKNIEKVNKLKTNYISEAFKYGNEQKFEKAIEYYKKALKENPNDLTIIQNIGICNFKLNQFKSAILYLEKVLNLPTLNDGKTEYVLGISYLNTNNKQKACYFLNLAANKNFAGAKELLTQYCK